MQNGKQVRMNVNECVGAAAAAIISCKATAAVRNFENNSHKFLWPHRQPRDKNNTPFHKISWDGSNVERCCCPHTYPEIPVNILRNGCGLFCSVRTVPDSNVVGNAARSLPVLLHAVFLWSVELTVFWVEDALVTSLLGRDGGCPAT